MSVFIVTSINYEIFRARWKYWINVFKLINRHTLKRTVAQNQSINYMIMLKNYLLITSVSSMLILISFDKQYHADQKRGELLAICAGLAILMAFIGFIGLINYSLELKEKEMTIRKILGAVFKDIFYLSSGNFALMTLLSTLVAIPMAYYLTQNWLDNFAIAIDVPLDVFVWSIIFMAMAVILVVYFQSARNYYRNSWDVLSKE